VKEVQGSETEVRGVSGERSKTPGVSEWVKRVELVKEGRQTPGSRGLRWWQGEHSD
jgi:hypothetical protein